MNRFHATTLSLLLLCVGLLLFAGCEHADHSEAPPEGASTPRQAQGPQSRHAALVALARSYHELADLAVTREDPPAAQGAMRDLIKALNDSAIDHRERTLFCMDAHARLARLQASTDVDLALTTVTQGLACERFDDAPVLFEGYLYQLQGDLFERQRRDGDAVKAHVHAIEVFTSIIQAASKE